MHEHGRLEPPRYGGRAAFCQRAWCSRATERRTVNLPTDSDSDVLAATTNDDDDDGPDYYNDDDGGPDYYNDDGAPDYDCSDSVCCHDRRADYGGHDGRGDDDDGRGDDDDNGRGDDDDGRGDDDCCGDDDCRSDHDYCCCTCSGDYRLRCKIVGDVRRRHRGDIRRG